MREKCSGGRGKGKKEYLYRKNEGKIEHFKLKGRKGRKGA
jgi:hypothetical protein